MECFFAKYTGDQLASTKWIMFYYVFFYDIENLGFYWILREHFHNFLIIKTLDEKRLKPLIYNELSLCCKLEFSIPISSQPDGLNLLYSKLDRIYSLKYLRSTRLGSNDIWIRKSKFEAKNQFLWFGFGPNPFLFS